MNHDEIIDQYSKGRTIKDLAIKYDVNQSVIREILVNYRNDQKAYMREMQAIAKTLPRHNDKTADNKWEAALGQGSFN